MNQEKFKHDRESQIWGRLRMTPRENLNYAAGQRTSLADSKGATAREGDGNKITRQPIKG